MTKLQTQATRAIRRRKVAFRQRHMSASSAPLDPLTLGALRAEALSAAAANMEAHPFDARVYLTTRGTANEVDSGALIDTNQLVYYVLVHGDFVCYLCSVPYGASAPRGHVISLVIDASSLDGTDFGLRSNEPTGLDRLGSATSLGF
jgi:hypothetical protein